MVRLGSRQTLKPAAHLPRAKYVGACATYSTRCTTHTRDGGNSDGGCGQDNHPPHIFLAHFISNLSRDSSGPHEHLRYEEEHLPPDDRFGPLSAEEGAGEQAPHHALDSRSIHGTEGGNLRVGGCRRSEEGGGSRRVKVLGWAYLFARVGDDYSRKRRNELCNDLRHSL